MAMVDLSLEQKSAAGLAWTVFKILTKFENGAGPCGARAVNWRTVAKDTSKIQIDKFNGVGGQYPTKEAGTFTFEARKKQIFSD